MESNHDTEVDQLKIDLKETTELLNAYMDLCAEQADAIEKMSALISKQAQRIRQMQTVHDFIDLDS